MCDIYMTSHNNSHSVTRTWKDTSNPYIHARGRLVMPPTSENIGRTLGRFRISPNLPLISPNLWPIRFIDRPTPVAPTAPYALADCSVMHADQLCQPAQTAERHKRPSNGPSAAVASEDRTERTSSARMIGSPPKLTAPTRPPNSSRSCMSRTADKLSRSHQLTSPKDLLCSNN